MNYLITKAINAGACESLDFNESYNNMRNDMINFGIEAVIVDYNECSENVKNVSIHDIYMKPTNDG